MKTRIRVLLGIILCAMCLSGCVRYDASVKVKKNGKADVAVIVAMSSAFSMDEYADYFDDEYGDEFSLSSGFTDEQIEEFEDRGFEVEKYKKDGYNGYKISKNDVDIEEFDGDDDLFDESFTIEKDGDIYTIDWKVFDASEEEEMLMMSSYMVASGGYMKFTMELPNKPIEHNATEVSDDGKTLTWDLLSLDDDQTVYVKYKAGGNGMLVPALICGGVLVLLAIIVIVVILVVMGKKKKQQQQMYAYDPYSQYYAQIGLQGEREMYQQNQNQFQQNQFGGQQNQFQQPQTQQFGQGQFNGQQNQFQQPQTQQFGQGQFQQPQTQQFGQGQFNGQQNQFQQPQTQQFQQANMNQSNVQQNQNNGQQDQSNVQQNQNNGQQNQNNAQNGPVNWQL